MKFFILDSEGHSIRYVMLTFQESAYYVPLTFNTGSGDVTSYNVTGLAPDTRYTIQVAALTRRGDGTRSQPVKIKTPGGVPSRPNITPRYAQLGAIYKLR